MNNEDDDMDAATLGWLGVMKEHAQSAVVDYARLKTDNANHTVALLASIVSACGAIERRARDGWMQ